MAKKRKKEKEADEKYEFVPPEFDEKQFLTDEIVTTKRVVLIILYGMVFGILAAFATTATKNGYFGLIILVVGAFLIKYFFATLKFDLSKFTKRTWAESVMWFFFTFLAIWILVVNPPFVDYIAPEIKNVRLSIDVQGTMVVYNYSFETHGWQTSAKNITVVKAMRSAFNNATSFNISAQVADSSGLSGNPVITLNPNNPKVGTMTPAGNNRFNYYIDLVGPTSYTTYLNNGQVFTFSISSEDTTNNQAIFDLKLPSEQIQVAV
jgi:hypothetical protein